MDNINININNNNCKNKKFGTREEVYKGIYTNTAGGLKKDDIIEKCLGTKIIYISKKLSDKMKINFNIIRANNPNQFKRIPKKTMVAPKIIDNYTNNIQSNNMVATQQQQPQQQPQQQLQSQQPQLQPQQQPQQSQQSQQQPQQQQPQQQQQQPQPQQPQPQPQQQPTNIIKNKKNNIVNSNKKAYKKTQKILFNITENKVKNVYYPELQGINITNLKEELLKEENEEDNGNTEHTQESNNSNYNDNDDVSLDDTCIYSKKNQFTVEEMPDIDIANLY